MVCPLRLNTHVPLSIPVWNLSTLERTLSSFYPMYDCLSTLVRTSPPQNRTNPRQGEHCLPLGYDLSYANQTLFDPDCALSTSAGPPSPPPPNAWVSKNPINLFFINWPARGSHIMGGGGGSHRLQQDTWANKANLLLYWLTDKHCKLILAQSGTRSIKYEKD